MRLECPGMKMLFFSFMLFLLSSSAYTQTKRISGQVKDAEGQPLVGATINVKGSKQSTTSDAGGLFSITIPANSKTLVITYIGMKPQEILIGGRSNIDDIALEEEGGGMDEVIVVGFGTQKKPTVVGAISTVKGVELVRSGIPSVANSLTGLVPGMVTVQATGLPGADDARIFIRGLSSFTGNNQPLVLVDGIERGLNDLDPNDVETISVLKDASATAAYGVKGGNGVILITTKRGQSGRMEISASYDHTLKTPVNSNIQENSYKTLAARDMLYRNRNAYGNVLGAKILEHYRVQDMPYIYPDVNLWDLMIKPVASDHRISVSARGGTQNAKYFISLGYLNQGDLTKNYQTQYDPSFKYDRLNFRMNFDFDVTRTTKIAISSGGYVGAQSQGGNDGQGDQASVMNNLYTTAPYASPYIYPASILEQYPDPLFPNTGDRVGMNLINPSSVPGFMRKNFKGTTRFVNNRLGADINLVQRLDALLKGLSFKAVFSYNNDVSFRGGGYTYQGEQYQLRLVGNTHIWERYIGTTIDNYTPINPPYQTALTRNGDPSYNYVYSGQFDYVNSFGKHNVSGLGLFQRRVSQSGAGFQHFEENWVARGTYDYEGRYLLEANLAISGSEQFAPQNRFGFFPAIAGGWNIAREAFFQKILPQVNNLKVRYSYGESGNDNTGTGYLYISDFSNYRNAILGPPGTTTTLPTVREGNVPNADAKWERNQKHNLGFELGAFKNKFTFTAELYQEKRTGILMARRSLADWFGQTLLSLNIGSVERHGYELEAGYNGAISSKINFWVKGNFNFNENRVIDQDDPDLTPDYQKREGKPLNFNATARNIGYYGDVDAIANYSLRQTGLMTVGADMLLDFNGDATTSNDAVPTGYSDRPDRTFSFSAGINNRSFDFSFMIQGAYNVTRNLGGYTNPLWTNDPGEMYVMIKNSDDVWTPDNTDAKYGAMGAWSPGNKALQNAKYARLKTAELGYNFAGPFLKKVGMSSARLALQGANLITWAPDFIWGDPENESTVSNVGFSFYPIPRRFTMSIKVNF
ncbi:SusC/RagA family TonB-linked outer membrane protein [Flavitalea antarctica]